MSDPLKIPVATIRKSEREEIRVTLAELKGIKFVDVRVYAEFAGATHARTPTKQGIVIAFDRLPEFVKALTQAEALAYRLGYLVKGGAEVR